MDRLVEALMKEASPGWIKVAYRSSKGRTLLLRRAATGSQDFVSKVETQVTGRKRRSQTRASMIAQMILDHVPGGQIQFALLAIDMGLATAGMLERVASRAAKSASVEDLIRLRRHALALEPEEAHRYLALARSLERETVEDAVVYDPLTGLSRGRTTPHADEVISLLQAAHRLAPGSAVIAFELGKKLLAQGEAQEALPLLERATVKNPQEQRLLLLAQAYRRPDIAKFSESMKAYEEVYRLNPKNFVSLAGIVHSGVRGPLAWSRVWRPVRMMETKRKKTPYKKPEVATYLDLLFEEGDLFSSGDVVTLLNILGSLAEQGNHLHPQTSALVVLRLHFLGYFSAGFALRERLAHNKIKSLRRTGVGGIGDLRQLMQAHVYVGEAELASRLSRDSEYWARGDSRLRNQVRKLNADAELMLGDPEPYFEYAVEARKGFYLPGEKAMVDLVKGKRVAIVGPAATGDELGRVIDTYDVVARPNFNPQVVAAHPEGLGSRTDIAYYSGQDLGRFIGELGPLVESSGLRIVNTRSFSFDAYSKKELPWLRFCRHDWSLSFHGSPLGIQRMIYDLLQFRPKQVTIFNSDFYTGTGEFISGYRDRRTFGPGSFMNDLVVVHDIMMDFKFTQAMLATGRVTAEGRAKEVLAQEPQEYLRTVEAAGVLA